MIHRGTLCSSPALEQARALIHPAAGTVNPPRDMDKQKIFPFKGSPSSLLMQLGELTLILFLISLN